MKYRYRTSFIVFLLLLSAPMAFAQATTSTLTGKVIQQGAGLPGVLVTISSPNLQGTRTTETTANGDFVLPGIPPGQYAVRFELEGMQTVTQNVSVGLGQTARADAELQLSTVSKSITITATAPAVLETTEIQSNYSGKLIEDLPIGRTLHATTSLAPGVTFAAGTSPTTATPTIVISGAYSYDSLFLINGAVTTENIRGQTDNLFIEDAIQETTVLTGGISAEYGRFTGGVVSAITKSGGNDFHGSLRDSLTNSSWGDDTPAGPQDPSDVLNETYEATLGGRFVRDRLWFFGSGRYFDQSFQQLLTNSDIFFDRGQEDKRLEGKMTGAITGRHSLVGSYMKYDIVQTGQCSFGCFEPSAVVPARQLPRTFYTANYNGVLSNQLLLEAIYSRRTLAFQNSGGTDPDRVTGSFGYDGGSTGQFFGAPVFCGICADKTRNNEDFGLKSTYFLATQGLGSHSFVAGYDDFTEDRTENNEQSASNYSVSVYQEEPFRDASGIIRPAIYGRDDAAGTAGDLIGYLPVLERSKTSEFNTRSVYLNDKWDLNKYLNFNIGVRYDKNDAVDASGNKVASDDHVSPRLGAIFDVRGDGKHRLNASYSQYVSRIADSIGNGVASAGNPVYIYYEYQGPTINADHTLTTFEAFRQLFAWFDANGGLANSSLIARSTFPGFNTRFAAGQIESPNVSEWTIGYGTQVGSRGFVRADYVTRDWSDFYASRTTPAFEKATAPSGQIADIRETFNSDALERTYDAVMLQASYRLTSRLNLGGNYTWSESKGNYDGETVGSGPVLDRSAEFPEYKNFGQNNPEGFLLNDQTHKARLWATWEQPTPIGQFNFSILERFDSGNPYSAFTTALSSRAFVTNPGYQTRPAGVTYYFTERGEFRWDDVTSTDLSVNYNIPVWTAELFAQGEVINVFNDDAVTVGSTAIRVNSAFNPSPKLRSKARKDRETATGRSSIRSVKRGMPPMINWRALIGFRSDFASRDV